ncbi:cytochrome P450 [Mycena albidolilacea]|uniref:Cytochrome P450 n=1 Tax=Mycena albidolilacea TaxID=1033008 RepID=A0AAD6Z0A0_9AGAR|nr:cytochrome P450 [Mycena albidolilacea]
MQYILNSPHFGRGPAPEHAMELVVDQKAVVFAKGDTHKRLRAALNIGFTSSAVRNYQPIFERVAEKITEQLSKCSGSLTDLYAILSPATLSAISEAVLGCSVRDLGEAFVANNERIVSLSSCQSSTQILVDAIASRLPKMVRGAAMYLPIAAFKVLRAVKSLADQIGRRAIAEKLAAAQQGANMRTDVFGMLYFVRLKSRHAVNPEQSDLKKNGLTEQELVSQTGILMIAGQDTVTNTLVFGCLELARHPEFQNQLREEIHASRRGSLSTFAYESMVETYKGMDQLIGALRKYLGSTHPKQESI